jgi:hypothetical protein
MALLYHGDPLCQWDWEAKHADRKKERKADATLHGATPFEFNRRVLKDVVREKMGVDVGQITFLSTGEYRVSHYRHGSLLTERCEYVKGPFIRCIISLLQHPPFTDRLSSSFRLIW